MRSYTRPLVLSGLGGETSAVQALERVALKREGASAYDEAWLQALIHDHPALLPVEQIEPALVPLVPVCREMPVPSGFVDNLLMTEEGGIVLVEAKLWRNPEGRRAVVGQVLDYAKDLAGFDYEGLQAAVLAARRTSDRFRGGEKAVSVRDRDDGLEQRPPPEILVQDGERFLVRLSDNKGSVVDLGQDRAFPPFNIVSLATHDGYWDEVTADEETLARVRRLFEAMMADPSSPAPPGPGESALGAVTPLYRLVCPDGSVEDEPAFIDAVQRNLRLGRFLLLVVGDGIQEGTEQLTDFLQRHIGLHFTLALVELSLWTHPGTGMVLVQPRILARTVQIERAVIRIEGGSGSIVPAALEAARPPTIRPATITEEEFFEQLERNRPGTAAPLKAFLERLRPLSVTGVVNRELNLRWENEAGETISLGQVTRKGELATDYAQRAALAKGRSDLAEDYQRALVAIIPGAIFRETASRAGWYVATPHGPARVPFVDILLARPDAWERVVADYVSALARAFDDNQNGRTA